MCSDLVQILKKLSHYVEKVIDEVISAGRIQPDIRVYSKWKIDKFDYTDRGISPREAHLEQSTRKTWSRAIFDIQETVKKSPEFTSALDELSRAFGKSDKFTQDIERFIRNLTDKKFNHPEFKESDTELDKFISIFLKGLKGEPVKYGADVELQGIVLRLHEIEVIPGIVLRQPKVEDLEKELPIDLPTSHMTPYPSAILNIEFLGRQVNEIQDRVKHAVSLLRLFKTGSVKWLLCKTYSESITDIFAGCLFTSGESPGRLEEYLLTEDDIPNLKEFWLRMTNSIPKSFFDPSITKIDHITISYNRYCDALLQNGILERRIANSVMGLEGLFLKPDEMQELSYRLRIRLSKLISLLGCNPQEVNSTLVDAYRIRSIFVHGGHLDYNQTRKLELKYKDIKNLLITALNYLRISLILMILVPKEKDELIDLIDDSLVDRKKEELLMNVIKQSGDLVVTS